MAPGKRTAGPFGFLRKPIWKGLSLLALCLVISILFALAFTHLELPHEQANRARRAELLLRLNATLGGDLALLDEIVSVFGTPSLDEALRDYNASLIPGGWDRLPKQEWDLTGSLFFCFTLATSIGYGFSTPLDPLTKGLVVPYILINIPLCLGSLCRPPSHGPRFAP